MIRAHLTGMEPLDRNRLLQRNPVWDRALFTQCDRIFQEVAERGDRALLELTCRFDAVTLDEIRVAPAEIARALKEINPKVRRALEQATHNIDHFHRAQLPLAESVRVQAGIHCWRESRAIERVGLYVPGGTAILPSTVLMLGIPARIAGCRRRIVCTPPAKDGSVPKEILAAAALVGIDEIYRVGGAQAIAALALGTESIPRVDKILGPGNRYVQVAKMLACQHGLAIDMVAGPSEVLVVADQSSPPDWIAGDLISQAEHGADSQVGLVTTCARMADAVLESVEIQLRDLPRRDLASESLQQSFVLTAESLEQAFEFSNAYAPEHLILHLEDAHRWLSHVESAGSVFLGAWTPEVAGDYASGTNHTLPTSGLARAFSGVSLDSFIKRMTVQELTAAGLRDLGPTLEELARVEGLEGHRRAVSRRLASLGEVRE